MAHEPDHMRKNENYKLKPEFCKGIDRVPNLIQPIVNREKNMLNGRLKLLCSFGSGCIGLTGHHNIVNTNSRKQSKHQANRDASNTTGSQTLFTCIWWCCAFVCWC